MGLSPLNMAFDGVNVWIANSGDNTVTKLRASDGKNLGTFTATAGTYGIAFDDTNMWVAGDPYLAELRPSDGKLLYFTRDLQGVAPASPLTGPTFGWLIRTATT